MPHHDPYDDDAIDGFLTGTSREGAGAALSSFVDDVRAASEAVPPPSPALAAAIAAGGIASAVVPAIAPWKKLNRKIKGFLGGLSVAGKVALGVGVAAAATTGAGAAGVLPGPVQHAFARATEAFTPFSPPDPGNHDGGGGIASGHDGGSTTTTTVGGDGTTTTLAPTEGDHNGSGDGNGVVTPTTEKHNPESTGDTTTTTAPSTDGHHSDAGGTADGNGTGDRNGDGTTTTPVGTGSGADNRQGGDSNNPRSLVLACTRQSLTISCNWSGDAGAGHVSYELLRVTQDDGHRVVDCIPPDGNECLDRHPQRGANRYMVDSLAADGHTVTAHSNVVTIWCCGDEPTTTTTNTTVPGGNQGGGHDGTTPTTLH
jgi:hypothetical protein